MNHSRLTAAALAAALALAGALGALQYLARQLPSGDPYTAYLKETP